jgi:hypothetical protein
VVEGSAGTVLGTLSARPTEVVITGVMSPRPPRGEGDRQLAQPGHARVAPVLVDVLDVDLVVGDAVKDPLDHHLRHQARQVRSDAAMRPEPKGEVAVGCSIQNCCAAYDFSALAVRLPVSVRPSQIENSHWVGSS